MRSLQAGSARRPAREATRGLDERLVALLDPVPGETVLELAAGPGDTGFIAAERLGPKGCLLSTDIAPEMVDAARRRAAELGVENVEFRVEDASSIDLSDASVDGVICRFGVMLVPDRRMRSPRSRGCCGRTVAPCSQSGRRRTTTTG